MFLFAPLRVPAATDVASSEGTAFEFSSLAVLGSMILIGGTYKYDGIKGRDIILRSKVR